MPKICISNLQKPGEKQLWCKVTTSFLQLQSSSAYCSLHKALAHLFTSHHQSMHRPRPASGELVLIPVRGLARRCRLPRARLCGSAERRGWGRTGRLLPEDIKVGRRRMASAGVRQLQESRCGAHRRLSLFWRPVSACPLCSYSAEDSVLRDVTTSKGLSGVFITGSICIAYQVLFVVIASCLFYRDFLDTTKSTSRTHVTLNSWLFWHFVLMFWS